MTPGRIAVLFGAGASKGAGSILPKAPPLGDGVYQALRQSHPVWKLVPKARNDLFTDSFESGMAELWRSSDRQTNDLLVAMTRFFTKFEPPLDQSDCYSRLLSFIAREQMAERIGIASLNYECVLEVAAARCGLDVVYDAERRTRSTLPIWKPHGSCNWLAKGLKVYNAGVDLRLVHFDGAVSTVGLDEARRRYDKGYSVPAIMSLFAPGKPTPLARSFVDRVRKMWGDWVASADSIIIVGARPMLEDPHVWEPIIASSIPVAYVGGVDDEHEQTRTFIRRLGMRFEFLGDRFISAYDGIEQRIRAS